MRPRRSCTSDVTICVPSPPRPGLNPSGSPSPSSATHTSSCSTPSSTAPLGLDLHRPAGRAARPCSTAFCTSSVRTMRQRGRVLGAHPPEGPRAARSAPAPPRVATSTTAASSRVDRPRRSPRSRRSPGEGLVHRARSSPPGAPPPRARSRALVVGSRRACSRSSAATVCRLFFTRWWISRIVASLVSSSRSRRRSSRDVAQQHQRPDPLPAPRSAGWPAARRVAPRGPRPRCATAPGR